MASIYKRPNKPGGTWWFKDDTGFRFSLKTKFDSEAQEYLRKYESKESSSRLGIVNRRAIFDDFLKEYEADLERRRRKYKTIKRALLSLRTFQNMMSPDRVFEVTETTARDWLKRRQDQIKAGEIALGTLAADIRHISAAWNRAIVLKLADKNPFENLDVKIHTDTEDKEPPRTLNADERKRLFQAAKDEDGPHPYIFANLFVWAGLRLQEATHLDVQDVDLENNWIVIRKKPCKVCPGCQAQGNMWTPKDYERRKIPITPELKPVLRQALKEAGRKIGLLCSHYGIEPWQERSIEKVFERLYKKAGITEANIKTCRHTFGTEMIRRVVSVRVVQKWMGHSKIETTMIYCHVEEEHSQEAMKKAASAAA